MNQGRSEETRQLREQIKDLVSAQGDYAKGAAEGVTGVMPNVPWGADVPGMKRLVEFNKGKQPKVALDTNYVRGWVAALDVRTGNELWRWYAVPAPGEPGSETWKDKINAWQTGGGAFYVLLRRRSSASSRSLRGPRSAAGTRTAASPRSGQRPTGRNTSSPPKRAEPAVI